MDLLDLITRSLPVPARYRSISAEEVITTDRQIDARALQEEIARARRSLQEGRWDIWERISRMSAYQTTSGFFGSHKLNILLLIHAHEASRGSTVSREWLDDALERAEEEIERIIETKRRQDRVGSFSTAVDFLGEVLEDDLVAFLADITCTSKITAKRWALGGGARRRNAFTVYSVAQALFAIYKEGGKSEVRRWMYGPLPSGNAPRDLWVGFSRRTEPELQAELRRRGLL